MNMSRALGELRYAVTIALHDWKGLNIKLEMSKRLYDFIVSSSPIKWEYKICQRTFMGIPIIVREDPEWDSLYNFTIQSDRQEAIVDYYLIG